MHLNIHSVALLTHREHFTHKPLPQRMRHVQLLRGIRRQLTQMGNIVLKSFTQTLLWSVNLGSVCFCESLSMWLILAVWQQFLLLRHGTIKNLLSFIPCTFVCL